MNTIPKDREPLVDDGEMSFEEMLEKSFVPKARIEVGDQLESTVVRIGEEYIFLNLGTRTEGLLRREEMVDDEGKLTVEVGQTLRVYAIAVQQESVLCGLRLSAGRAKEGDKEAALEGLKEAKASRMPVEGTVKEVVNGGFSVTVMGLRAFCPISQISNVYCETPEAHLNQTYDFEIIKLEEGGRNIVLSRRVILEREAEEKARELWSRLEVGATYEGTVTSLRSYGAFVDIGGVEGLLHVSEVSYDRVEDLGSVLEKGQRIQVSIKEIDAARKRISLSLKALMQDPWESAAADLTVNQVVKGWVVRIAPFGAFVQILPGVEGLVHISEMSEEKRVNNPRELLSEGQEVAVKILNVDLEKKRISLTMKTEDDESGWREELGERRSSSGGGMGTLGDLLQEKLKK